MAGVAWLRREPEWVAVDKASGVPVIPARGEPPEDCLLRQVEAELGERMLVVHRIDRETSGVVLFARSAEAHRRLNQAFEERRVEKVYMAFVAGSLSPLAGRIEIPLHGARRGKARPAQPGEPGLQHAATEYTVERTWRRGEISFSRLSLRPLTGRHHQLRVHLRARQAPILFDRLYGRGAAGDVAGAPCRRLALHAALIAIDSTALGAVRAEAPLAPDLALLEAWLARAQ